MTLEPISRILGRLTRDETAGHERFATAVLGAVNEALASVLRPHRDQAKAISFKHGTVVVRVSHGAIAGFIQMYQPEIIDRANRRLSLALGSPPTINRIVTRQG
ncbi:MAG: DUF721 domain-containing protein [Candidatus Kerfeldbacteria bacterium]|nr:DUF721 domain-containing protein [Candidatus Kerfeldbacteria bacterium]